MTTTTKKRVHEWENSLLVGGSVNFFMFINSMMFHDDFHSVLLYSATLRNSEEIHVNLRHNRTKRRQVLEKSFLENLLSTRVVFGPNNNIISKPLKQSKVLIEFQFFRSRSSTNENIKESLNFKQQ